MDTATIHAAQAGDRAALASIVDEFTPTVLGAAYGLCGNWDTAADVAQEVFATMLVRLGDLRSPEALPGWLMAVVRSSARRERRTSVVVAPEPEPEPAEVVVDRDEAARLRAALESLPTDLRLPMVLHYFSGLALREIGSWCELPVSTVKQRMRVARARLREGLRERVPVMSTDLIQPPADPSDAIRFYTAMRSGDLARVDAMLDARPDLVDIREDWSRAESFAHRLPANGGGGTPLLRAVERGDTAMVALLLARGADPNGACTCAGGEKPLWVAVVQREVVIVQLLLSHGADPNPVAFSGLSAVDVARQRGYDDILRLLGVPGVHRADAPVIGRDDSDQWVTGIKTIDLWCPLPARGLVSLTPGLGIGAMVMVAELSVRAARSGQSVVWTGFVQAPTDLGDLHHGLAESGLTQTVHVSMAPHTAPLDVQVAALDEGVAMAGPDALLVVFAETARLHLCEERLPSLARRRAVTLVVAPLDGSVSQPSPVGSPYAASIAFDPSRAKRGLWPAVSSSSWSKVGDTGLADLARAHMTDELDAYLAQPLVLGEPFTGSPAEFVPLAELHRAVTNLTSRCDP